MSSPSKHHDPLFHYETHYPERLSRLHVGEFGPAGAFKKSRKTRQRTGIRYKTQPVTFDEITEVDEEPASEESGGGGSKDGSGKAGRNLVGQLQAFSRSMDGLLPRIPEQVMLHPLTSPPRRHHFERPPSIPSIPERAESSNKSPAVLPEASSSDNPFFPASTSAPPSEDRLQDKARASRLVETSPSQGQTSLKVHTGAEGGSEASAGPPIPTPNMASRRPKVTAKAKKRQKAAEQFGGGNDT